MLCPVGDKMGGAVLDCRRGRSVAKWIWVRHSPLMLGNSGFQLTTYTPKMSDLREGGYKFH